MESTLVGEKSTHQVPIFRLKELKIHPNADRLKLIDINDTSYTYCGNYDDWKDRVGSLVAWIPPDSLVDVSRPEFSFLAPEAKYDENSEPSIAGKYARIKAKKLRGIVSYGLLVPAPEVDGDNAAQALGVHHYERPIGTAYEMINGVKIQVAGGEVESPPEGIYPKYDVDSFMKYGKYLFIENEPCVVTEKIHGCNAKYVFKNDKQYCGSRTEWKKELSTPPKLTVEDLTEKVGDPVRAQEIFDKAVTNFKPTTSLWWKAFRSTPSLKLFCETNPGYCIYGEVYGQVQKGYDYGVKAGEIAFRAFDILTPEGRWMDFDKASNVARAYKIPWVPILNEGLPYNFECLLAKAEGQSTLANHIREGVVVSPIKERWDARLGRVKLKIINPKYLERD